MIVLPGELLRCMTAVSCERSTGGLCLMQLKPLCWEGPVGELRHF